MVQFEQGKQHQITTAASTLLLLQTWGLLLWGLRGFGYGSNTALRCAKCDLLLAGDYCICLLLGRLQQVEQALPALMCSCICLQHARGPHG